MVNGPVPVKKHTYSTAGEILQQQVFHHESICQVMSILSSSAVDSLQQYL